MTLFLASNSPRRAELLSQINIKFEHVSIEVNETQNDNESSQEYVQRLALEKAKVGWDKIQENLLIDHVKSAALGVDTIIVYDNIVMEKPKNKAHAREMMMLLSENTHQVVTAVALVNDLQESVKLVISEVSFKMLTEQEISDYWETGEPQDKAGGYGIQGFAGQFVTHISGSYSAVVGLPLYETAELIKSFKGVSNVC